MKKRDLGQILTTASLALVVCLLGVPAECAPTGTLEPGAGPRTTEPVPALANARCGPLTVPENRAKPNGRTISLPVAILPAQSDANPPDPIVYTWKRPRRSGAPSADLLVAAGLNRRHHVIVMGQRGTRYAEPALLCPEIDDFNARRGGLAYDAPSTGALYVEAVRKCYQRLSAEGIDLGAYNTTEDAAGLPRLARAQGACRAA